VYKLMCEQTHSYILRAVVSIGFVYILVSTVRRVCYSASAALFTRGVNRLRVYYPSNGAAD